MKRFGSIVVFCALIVVGFSASAENDSSGYFAVHLGSRSREVPARPIHVIVSGIGKDLKTLFSSAAVARAKKRREVSPNENVVLLLHNETGVEKMRELLRRWGLIQQATFREEVLDFAAVVRQARVAGGRVASLEFFSHSTRDFAMLGSADARLDVNEVLLPDMKRLFIENAYVFFHGCNAGFSLAPDLAKIWGVPVAGAMTSTDLQRLHLTNEFYAYNAITKPEGDWKAENDLSFLAPISCLQGVCLRMKPDPFPYDGIWGKFEQGLPNFKFFCGPMNENECARRMALSLLPWLSTKPLARKSSLNDWKHILGDFLCSIHHRRPLRLECLAKLGEIERGLSLTYSPFWGKELSCDFRRCYEGEIPPERLQTSSTFAREYQMYLRGLALLGIVGSSPH